MEPLNPDLEREIDDFFDEAKQKFDSIFNQFCSDPMRVYEDQSDLFLKRRDELLKNFELHLFKSCSVLKDLEDGANLNLNDVLNEKINKLTNDENQANNDLNELSSQKDKLRTMLDEKSNLIKESIEKKREIERICNESVKEEFVRLCKFMNLKFQWNQTDQKFTIGKQSFLYMNFE